MDEKEIDNIAREIVAYYMEFRNVLDNNNWRNRFKFSYFSCSCKCDCGFSKELYYECRVEIPNRGIYIIDGKQVINEPISEIIMHWNNEVQYIAPHFKVVKEYESDRELREFLQDGYHYYLETNTLTKLFFFHISYKKREKITDMIFSSVRKYLPKDAKIYDPREGGLNYGPDGWFFSLEFGI